MEIVWNIETQKISNGSVIKRKDGQMGLYQTKNFCIAKEIVASLKTTEGEKIFATYSSDKGLFI
jgi:hypothetical protein